MESSKEIFERLRLSKFTQYLIYGMDEDVHHDSLSYDERIKGSEEHILKFLRMNFPEHMEYDSVVETFLDHGNVMKEVYMEIGVKCGISLATQLMSLQNNKD